MNSIKFTKSLAQHHSYNSNSKKTKKTQNIYNSNIHKNKAEVEKKKSFEANKLIS